MLMSMVKTSAEQRKHRCRQSWFLRQEILGRKARPGKGKWITSKKITDMFGVMEEATSMEWPGVASLRGCCCLLRGEG